MLCTLDIAVDEDVTCALTSDQLLEACEHVLAAEGVTRPCFVSLSVVSDQRIRELNEQWRGIDRATDVISLECERPDDPELAPDEPCELGDIVLAPDYIKAQAATFGTTPGDETRLLLVHGMLHLLGYDHVDEADALVMEAREDELVAQICGSVPPGGITLTRHRDEVLT